eukprot:3943331-Amphidinium_carterae.1
MEKFANLGCKFFPPSQHIGEHSKTLFYYTPPAEDSTTSAEYAPNEDNKCTKRFTQNDLSIAGACVPIVVTPEHNT